MMLLPCHKADYVESGGEPNNEYERGYLAALNGEVCPKDIEYAKDIYEDAYKCEVLEAFLLSRASPKEIETAVRVPENVTNIYRYLFFDMNVFKDELDVEAYAQTYKDNTWGRDLKICAITLGLDYLRYRFSRGKNNDINIVSALNNMIETGYMLAKATKLNPLDSGAAKEARQWMQASIKGMEAYVRVKPATEEYSDDFRIALQKIDRTTNGLKDPSIPLDDIVH